MSVTPRDVAPKAQADAELVAHAVLDEGFPFGLATPAAADFAARCDHALTLLGTADSLTRLKLVSYRAVAAIHAAGIRAPAFSSALLGGTRERSPGVAVDAMADAAEELAARLGTALARAYARVARCILQAGPEHTETRLLAAREILDAASDHGDRHLVPVGHLILLIALLEKGELQRLDLELVGRGIVSARFPELENSAPARWFRCLRTILDGDILLADTLVEEQYLESSLREGSDALAVYTTHRGIIHWMQGRIDDLEDDFMTVRRQHPEQLFWSVSLVWLWLKQGRRTAAEALFESVQDLEAIPHDAYWLATMTLLAEIATEIGPRSFAEKVRRVLEPYAGWLVHVGIAVSFWGTVARALGLLEERLGMLAEAREHLELAVELTARVGAQAWLAEAQIELAEFAIRHHLGNVPAYELLAEAKAASDARGFTALARRAVHRPRIQVLGRFDVVSHDGHRFDWSSRKARDLLKMLVAARGVATAREVFMDALWPGEAPENLQNRFSVALSMVRRALDPQRALPRHQHVVVEGESLRIDLDNVDVDLERFFALAKCGDEMCRSAAMGLYAGDAFAEDQYADWAVDVRAEARQVHVSLGYA